MVGRVAILRGIQKPKTKNTPPMKMPLMPIGAPAVAIAVATGLAIAAAAAVEDGFPDQSSHVVASAASAAAADFDSFVCATGVSSASLNDFHSFVSTVVESSGTLDRFNSHEAQGFMLIVR